MNFITFFFKTATWRATFSPTRVCATAVGWNIQIQQEKKVCVKKISVAHVHQYYSRVLTEDCKMKGTTCNIFFFVTWENDDTINTHVKVSVLWNRHSLHKLRGLLQTGRYECEVDLTVGLFKGWFSIDVYSTVSLSGARGVASLKNPGLTDSLGSSLRWPWQQLRNSSRLTDLNISW